MYINPVYFWAVVAVLFVFAIAGILWQQVNSAPVQEDEATDTAFEKMRQQYAEHVAEQDPNWLRESKRIGIAAGFVTPQAHQHAVEEYRRQTNAVVPQAHQHAIEEYRRHQEPAALTSGGLLLRPESPGPGRHSSAPAERLPEPSKEKPLQQIAAEVKAHFLAEQARGMCYELKIIHCSDPSLWYAKFIGTDKRFPYIRYIESEGVYLSREPAGYLNIIRHQDAALIKKEGI